MNTKITGVTANDHLENTINALEKFQGSPLTSGKRLKKTVDFLTLQMKLGADHEYKNLFDKEPTKTTIDSWIITTVHHDISGEDPLTLDDISSRIALSIPKLESIVIEEIRKAFPDNDSTSDDIFIGNEFRDIQDVVERIAHDRGMTHDIILSELSKLNAVEALDWCIEYLEYDYIIDNLLPNLNYGTVSISWEHQYAEM
jgi:hypothetical protein